MYNIRSLDTAVDTAAFSCGQPTLDVYIHRYAGQDIRRNVARVFIATPEDDAQKLAGFYTLNAGSVSCTELPEALARKLPKYPVPVALIGRLAVAQEYQGQGLGAILLVDACQKVVQASAILAIAGIIVDAKDAAGFAFYQHFGFTPLPGQSKRLMLPINTVQQM